MESRIFITSRVICTKTFPSNLREIGVTTKGASQTSVNPVDIHIHMVKLQNLSHLVKHPFKWPTCRVEDTIDYLPILAHRVDDRLCV